MEKSIYQWFRDSSKTRSIKYHSLAYLVTILKALINMFSFFFAEIADNASLSCVEETGSSATESDSIGSLRNSSPENINTVASLTTLAGSCSSKDLGLSHKNKGISHGNRISSPSPRINR